MKPGAARYRGAVRLQLWALAALVLIFALDEYVDLPQYIFGDVMTPLRHHEFLMEAGALVVVGALVLLLSRLTIKRATELESLLLMCAWCGRIKHDGAWTPIETFLRTGSDTIATRGLCPTCYDRNVQSTASR